MNLLQCQAHKRFSKPIATVDSLTAAPFTVTALEPASVDDNKKIFYYWVDPKVVAELIKNILIDAEYSKLM